MSISFKTIHWNNQGDGVTTFAQVWDENNNVIWNPRDYGDIYWEMTQGREKWCDPGKDTDGNNKPLAQDIIKPGVPIKIGFNVVWGNDDWYNDKTFVYDPNSNVTVVFRKYGGLRNGDCAYDGQTS